MPAHFPDIFQPPLKEKINRYEDIYYNKDKEGVFNGLEFYLPASLRELEHKFVRGAIYDVLLKDAKTDEVHFKGKHGEFIIFDKNNFENFILDSKYRIVESVPNLSNKEFPFKAKFQKIL